MHRHGSLSSLTHTASANRVYVRVGEDTTMPSVCQLQSLFLSHNYLTSDLQPQEEQGCAPVGGGDPEVHVIKLHSAGFRDLWFSAGGGDYFLVPPGANAGWHKLVLILSSAVPVNWALTVPGLRGHISVYSSNSVSPLYPPEPDLTLTSMLTSDLSTTHDLLSWANQSGFPKVTSYTEADLANRFVIRLAGGGTEGGPPVRMLDGRPSWVQERRLRQWLSGGGGRTSGGWEAVRQCSVSGRTTQRGRGQTHSADPVSAGVGGDTAGSSVPGPVQQQPFLVGIPGHFLWH